MQDPVYLALGLHAHQPVGNFDHVFQEHLKDVYNPFLAKAEEGDLLPLTLHLSGPLLDWMETHDTSYLDRVGRLVSDGKLELLLAGYYEPILPALLQEDRVEQIQWMKEALRSRFGVDARGLWLTERVWEPDLARDLVEAGVDYLLVDDRHFVAAGFPRDQLHLPFRTEFGGKSLGVFAIDETLRYFLPFQQPKDTVSYLRELRATGRRLAVAADDIEKFGGWPGTREWVYERGWLDAFIAAMKKLEEAGEIKLVTFAQALSELPSGGPAYLPSSTYREMEEWALPPESVRRLDAIKKSLDEQGFTQGESPLIRGSHWRNFLVKYPEANRMHKKAAALSTLCRAAGNPPKARRALGAAQCNDAYWHGVFGGLYLRHLRDTVWQKMAEAEGVLREGSELTCQEVDLDLDGNPELWIHSADFSALMSPARGGAVEELTLFRPGVNLANTLTRRREAYHQSSREPEEETEGDGGSEGDGSHTPSIHDLEGRLRFGDLPPVDLDNRALFVDRILPGELDLEAYRAGQYQPHVNWASRHLRPANPEEGVQGDSLQQEGPPARWLEVCLEDPEMEAYQKRIRFESDGAIEVFYHWDPQHFPEDALFSTEISLGAEAEVRAVPHHQIWRFPIATFSKSERGYDETIQGESVTVLWPAQIGWARIRLTAK